MSVACVRCGKRPAAKCQKWPAIVGYCQQCINNARRDLRVAGVARNETSVLARLEGSPARRDGPPRRTTTTHASGGLKRIAQLAGRLEVAMQELRELVDEADIELAWLRQIVGAVDERNETTATPEAASSEE